MDPIELLAIQARAASDQQFAFYTEHLKMLVTAYRKHRDHHDPDVLKQNMTRALMESDNDREALCYQVVCAIDLLARRQ